ncbi:uncharacterized protein LOC107479188 [Arachis duranensis]|uniref:Uncharacterized protein LOC107479188 n=1 Tax=Arachis duranensis TaxID=130453 RepID=A0A6P4CUM9_ARADU|nr:uncharacterized protein LOC107479188 [Arachis duranensis]XP_025677275.1 diacylglycerol kinase kappa-like [Arachis hypogaea]
MATLSGVERRQMDWMSVLINKQPFLPYGNYDGPPQKKRKTTEPSSSAEPSASPAPPVPWIVAKFDGRDPGPPPLDTPEPEPQTKEPAAEEPAAEVGQADETLEQIGAEATVEEPTDHMVEEPAVVAEPIVETISEPAGQTSEEHRPEPASHPSTNIIVYHRCHHPQLPDGGTS